MFLLPLTREAVWELTNQPEVEEDKLKSIEAAKGFSPSRQQTPGLEVYRCEKQRRRGRNWRRLPSVSLYCFEAPVVNAAAMEPNAMLACGQTHAYGRCIHCLCLHDPTGSCIRFGGTCWIAPLKRIWVRRRFWHSRVCEGCGYDSFGYSNQPPSQKSRKNLDQISFLWEVWNDILDKLT